MKRHPIIAALILALLLIGGGSTLSGCGGNPYAGLGKIPNAGGYQQRVREPQTRLAVNQSPQHGVGARHDGRSRRR